jgi:hypothetical protein
MFITRMRDAGIGVGLRNRPETDIARFSKFLKVDAEHRRSGSSDRPSPDAPELNAKSSEGVCHVPVSIDVRSAGPKVEPKKSLRMSAPLAEPVASKKSTRQTTPRTTSQPTNLFWVMIEPLGP